MTSADTEREFDAFFHEVMPRVQGLAYRITGNRQDAEDVTIEAFGRAYVKWGTLADSPARNGWVVTTASNAALDIVRRRSLHRESALGEEPGTADDPGDLVADRLSFIDDLRTLPTRQRQVVVLVHALGMSHAEAAMTLGISLGTAKAHLHRATTRLRRLMGRSDQRSSHGD